jgi:type II secretory pathway component PulC
MVLVALAVALLLIAFRIVYLGQTSVKNTGAIQPPEEINIPVQDVIPAEDWTAFSNSGADAGSGTSSGRFRLAGTFFLMGADDGSRDENHQRLAIIDDLVSNTQHIVSEGQSFEEHEILRIYQDRLIIRHDGNEYELTLSFKNGVITQRSEPESSTNKIQQVEEEVLETNRFGKRIGETRWVFQKQALIDFYQELLDNPERIAAIYMSMKPDFDEEGEVSGFRLEKEGESDFFDAVGLKEGDKIRKVNSMRMVSQARGEYFISEFMKDRLGAVVLDVERDGKEEKLIYLFR